jgi:RNA polymerase sigma-70 factor, ECF subfamily
MAAASVTLSGCGEAPGLAAAGDVTQLLTRWAQGDNNAFDSLMLIVYSELHQIANGYLRRERSGHTLQPTALVNEAWLRLVKQEQASFDTRKQFFALAAQIMRRVLVDHARSLNAEKRGGGGPKVTFEDMFVFGENRVDEFLALEQALGKMQHFSPRMAQVVELRYFGGLNVHEVAELLGISIATVSREQHAAEAWLSQAMSTPADAKLRASAPEI